MIFSSVFSLPFYFVITFLDFVVAVVRALNIFWMVLCMDWLYYHHYDYYQNAYKQSATAYPCCLSDSILRCWRNV